MGAPEGGEEGQKVTMPYCAMLCIDVHAGCGLNMFKQRLNASKWAFIPWSWIKQDVMVDFTEVRL